MIEFLCNEAPQLIKSKMNRDRMKFYWQRLSRGQRFAHSGVLFLIGGGIYFTKYYVPRIQEFKKIESKIDTNKDGNLTRHKKFEDLFVKENILSRTNHREQDYSDNEVSISNFVRLCNYELPRELQNDARTYCMYFLRGDVLNACKQDVYISRGEEVTYMAAAKAFFTGDNHSTLRMTSPSGDHCGHALVATYIAACDIASLKKSNGQMPIDKVSPRLMEDYNTFCLKYFKKHQKCKGKYLTEEQLEEIIRRLRCNQSYS